MGDAVRHVQRHLQEMSREQLVGVEEQHHGNLKWLQDEFQKLCQRVDVDVHVELMRQPPPAALVKRGASVDHGGATANATTRTMEMEVIAMASEDVRVGKRPRAQQGTTAMSSAVETRMETRVVRKLVTRTRKVLRPKRVMRTTRASLLAAQKAPRRWSTRSSSARSSRSSRASVRRESSLNPTGILALKVTDLKAELKRRGLKMTGVKAVLADRLLDAMAEEDRLGLMGHESGLMSHDEEDGEEMEEVEEEYEEEVDVEEQVPVSVSVPVPVPVQMEVSAKPRVPVRRGRIAAEEDVGDDTQSTEDTQPVDSALVQQRREESRRGDHTEDIGRLRQEAERMSLEDADAQSPLFNVYKVRNPSRGSVHQAVDEIVHDSDGGGDEMTPQVKKTFTFSTIPTSRSVLSPVAEAASVPSRHAETFELDTVAKEPAETNLWGNRSKRGADAQAIRSPVGSAPTVSESSFMNNAVVATSSPMVASAVERSTSVGSLAKDSAATTEAMEDTDDLLKYRSTNGIIARVLERNAENKRAASSRWAATQASSAGQSMPIENNTNDSVHAAASDPYTIGEDSEPSPHRVSFAPDTVDSARSTNSGLTRAASTSRLEIQRSTSSVKTPEAAISTTEVQSEPRVTAATKNKVLSDVERKYLEEQESIEREAMRLRLAAKQSAKKRFEEAKASSLFWAKRDLIKQQLQSASSHSGSSGEKEYASHTSASTPSPMLSTSDSKSPQRTVHDNSGKEFSRSPASGMPVEVHSDDQKSHSKVNSTQGLSMNETNRNRPAKRPSPIDDSDPRHPPRKRVSLEKDRAGSTQTQRPDTQARDSGERSTKRASITKESQEASVRRLSASKGPVTKSAKRTSISRGRLSNELAANRMSTGKGRSVSSKRVSSGKENQPKDVIVKHVSLASRPNSSGTTSRQSPPTDDPLSATQSSSSSVHGVDSFVSLNVPSGRRDSASSSRSSTSSSSSASDVGEASKTLASGSSRTADNRKPSNLVSGLHSFTSLLEKDSANLSSSQGSATSASSRQAPVVNALKMAEKSRLLEQKKTMEKMKRKEALMKRYEEQRRLDEEKKKKLALIKERAERAEREAKQQREHEKALEKKQREIELAKKRRLRLQEMRAGLEKKRVQQAADRAALKPSATTVSAPASTTSTAATAGQPPRVVNSGMPSSQQPKATTKGSSQPTTSSTKPSAAAKPTTAKTTTGAGRPPVGASKQQRPVQANPVKKKANELTTYEMSDRGDSCGSDDSDDSSKADASGKNIPRWAQREYLERALRVQFGPNAPDPTPSIFPDFVDSCDLEAIFEPTDTRKKKRFQRRTSSGNWLGDRPTAREKAVYKRDMGFLR